MRSYKIVLCTEELHNICLSNLEIGGKDFLYFIKLYT